MKKDSAKIIINHHVFLWRDNFGAPQHVLPDLTEILTTNYNSDLDLANRIIFSGVRKHRFKYTVILGQLDVSEYEIYSNFEHKNSQVWVYEILTGKNNVYAKTCKTLVRINHLVTHKSYELCIQNKLSLLDSQKLELLSTNMAKPKNNSESHSDDKDIGDLLELTGDLKDMDGRY